MNNEVSLILCCCFVFVVFFCVFFFGGGGVEVVFFFVCVCFFLHIFPSLLFFNRKKIYGNVNFIIHHNERMWVMA